MSSSRHEEKGRPRHARTIRRLSGRTGRRRPKARPASGEVTPRVQAYMSTALHTVRPEDSIGSAFKKLSMNRIRHLLVVDGAGRLQGIITDRDIRLALPSLAFNSDLGDLYLRLEDLKVHQVMTRNVYTTRPGSPLAEAVDLCLRHTIGALPVLQDGVLVGIITETDLLRALRDRLGLAQTRGKPDG